MSQSQRPQILPPIGTLLAWNRTSLSLMAFGFVIERFGLFVSIPQHNVPMQRGRAWTGLAFVLLGPVFVAIFSTFNTSNCSAR